MQILEDPGLKMNSHIKTSFATSYTVLYCGRSLVHITHVIIDQ